MLTHVNPVGDHHASAMEVSPNEWTGVMNTVHCSKSFATYVMHLNPVRDHHASAVDASAVEASPNEWRGTAAEAHGRRPSGLLCTSPRQCPRLLLLPSSHVPSAPHLIVSALMVSAFREISVSVDSAGVQEDHSQCRECQRSGNSQKPLTLYHLGPPNHSTPSIITVERPTWKCQGHQLDQTSSPVGC